MFVLIDEAFKKGYKGKGRGDYMLKRERLNTILQMVNEKGIVDTAEIIEKLGVSDMTIRRDLDELERNGKLVRIRGGAQLIDYNIDYELSHLQKSTVKVHEKMEIARYAASLIQDQETIFLGPGTTIELLASLIAERNIRVVTPSLPAFEALKDSFDDRILLIGGAYRSTTGSFVGPLANKVLKNLKFSKAFISCNGIADDEITTSSMAEGELQALACRNAKETYLLADSHKFNREDFYVYYHLYNIDELITDSSVSQDVLDHYEEFTRIVQTRGEEEK